jgi:hypothetical protein
VAVIRAGADREEDCQTGSHGPSPGM